MSMDPSQRVKLNGERPQSTPYQYLLHLLVRCEECGEVEDKFLNVRAQEELTFNDLADDVTKVLKANPGAELKHWHVVEAYRSVGT